MYTVRSIIETGRMRIIRRPPFNESRFAICDRQHEPSAPNTAFVPENIPSEYADRKVWLAYHYEPLRETEEPFCVLCID